MLQITDSEVSAGKLVLAMDAFFGLPRKKSAGTSYRDPLHGELFFCRQSPVDLFVEESAMSKKSTASTNVSALECNSRSSLIRVYSWGHSDKNREAKGGIAGIRSNLADDSVKRVGKSIGYTVGVLSNFDAINGISGRHSKRSTVKDMKLLLKQLYEETEVFTENTGRFHKSFPKFKANPTRYLSVKKTTQWMGEKLQKLLTGQCRLIMINSTHNV